MKKALYMAGQWAMPKVFPKYVQEQIAELYNVKDFIYPTAGKPADYADQLKDVSAIFSSWGSAKYDKELLDLMPNLEVIYYAAGSMKQLLTDEVWERGIRVTTANSINAIPVAEFSLSQILFSLKNGYLNINKYKQERDFSFGDQYSLGAYHQQVGIVSLSQIGRRVVELLKPFQLEVVYYDPYVASSEGEKLRARKVELDQLFSSSQIVSLHSPLLPETEGMVTGKLLDSMPEYGTFINTARGAIVNEPEMIEVLKKRSDLTAILDVTNPEPVAKDSSLFEMSNLVLTPHIAGSLGSEISRMGQGMVDEAKSFLAGEAMTYEITEESYRSMA